MCVIAFSPKGVSIPTPEQIKSMWEHNPDGAGYAYVNKQGKVVYRKGFMTLASLLGDLQAPERFKNTNFAIHFRIGTSGKNDGATCHPFPVSNNFGDLRKTEGEVDSVLFHNGVLSQGGISSPLASDTQDFVIAMSPLLQKYNRSKARDFFIDELVKGSKLLILYKNNAFKMFGDWKKDGDLWVSNLYYKQDYSWYGGGYYGYHEYRYDDDGNFYDSYYGKPNKEKAEEGKLVNVVPPSDEVLNLVDEIVKKEYKWLEPQELKLLQVNADYCTNDIIEIAGYKLGYDDYQMLAWVEDTPVCVEELNKLPMGAMYD